MKITPLYFSAHCLLREVLEHMFRKGPKNQAVAEDGANTKDGWLSTCGKRLRPTQRISLQSASTK